MANNYVRGDIRAATAEGFKELLDKADEHIASGFELRQVVNLTTQVKGKRVLALGAVYVRPPSKDSASLVDYE